MLDYIIGKYVDQSWGGIFNALWCTQRLWLIQVFLWEWINHEILFCESSSLISENLHLFSISGKED